MILSAGSAGTLALLLGCCALLAYAVAVLPAQRVGRAAVGAFMAGVVAHVAMLLAEIGSLGLGGGVVRLGFGPVLSLIGYEDDEDAIRIANDTVYGLSGYVSSGDPERAKRVARRLRTGNVHLNGAPVDNKAPFGGYKQSGNGREWGLYGLEEFLEVKAIMGYNAA